MDLEAQKRAAATAAIEWASPKLAPGVVIGVGTGSTADHFIDLLGPYRDRFAGAVASSSRSAARLAALGIRVFDLDDAGELPFYVDGADEINGDLEMTKGGGGALTREKIVAAASATFVCIVDASKRVETLGRFALPVEVIPMARSHVVRKLVALAAAERLATPTIVERAGKDGAPFVTDNGNRIVDVAGWTIVDARSLETRIGEIVGVVESGLFARRPADLLLAASERGVETVRRR
jgi:ribose 5-phosphate isomerase A